MLKKGIAGLFSALVLMGVLSMAGCASDGMMMEEDDMDKSMDDSMMDDSHGDMEDSMGKDMDDAM